MPALEECLHSLLVDPLISAENYIAINVTRLSCQTSPLQDSPHVVPPMLGLIVDRQFVKFRAVHFGQFQPLVDAVVVYIYMGIVTEEDVLDLGPISLPPTSKSQDAIGY